MAHVCARFGGLVRVDVESSAGSIEWPQDGPTQPPRGLLWLASSHMLAVCSLPEADGSSSRPDASVSRFVVGLATSLDRLLCFVEIIPEEQRFQILQFHLRDLAIDLDGVFLDNGGGNFLGKNPNTKVVVAWPSRQ